MQYLKANSRQKRMLVQNSFVLDRQQQSLSLSGTGNKSEEMFQIEKLVAMERQRMYKMLDEFKTESHELRKLKDERNME